jgi:hypothetical protein
MTYRKGNDMITETFSAGELAVAIGYARAAFVAWRGEAVAAKSAVGSDAWLASVRAMYA